MLVGAGLIYLGILALWGVYFAARILRRGDGSGNATDVDRFSGSARILHARGRPPVARARAARRPGCRPHVLAWRRAVLAALVVLSLAMVVPALLGLAPPWVPGVLGFLTVGYVVRLRAHVRRSAQRRARSASAASGRGAAAPGDDARGARRAPEPQPQLRAAPREQPRDRKRVAEAITVAEQDGARQRDEEHHRVAAEAAASRAVEAAARREIQRQLLRDGGEWEPTPITLPTYVTKPRAPRPARVIDLAMPGSWTAAPRPPDSPGGAGEVTGTTADPAAVAPHAVGG